jgi:hypothetical protein
MCHMVAHAARYDRAPAQVTRVFSGKEEECSGEERRMYHTKRGYCHATIISCLPMKEDEATTKKKKAKKHRWGQRDDDCVINSDDEKYSNF